mgnify:FL=1
MLKILRKQNGLTQSQLGKITGLSQSYISVLEKNYFVSSPTIRQVLILSDALGVDKVELFLYFAKKELEYIGNK